MIHVLIIDDDPKICLFFQTLLNKMGHASSAAHTVETGLQVAREGHFDLILLDLELPDGNGLEILPGLAGLPSRPEVIIITGTGDAGGAQLAFKYGAWDYVQKPFLLDEVSLPITRALQYRAEKLSAPKLVPLIRPDITGESDAIRKCLEEVGMAAATDASILITGETGTGKELFARAIHRNSRRAAEPFIAIDCGALPDTLVESTLFGHEKGAFTGAGKAQPGLLSLADKGTVMLDEVGDLPLPAQKSFLRTLQEKCVRPLGSSKEIPVDFRLIAATNLDLDRMARENRFRRDLLFRIRAMEIKLPPLRDRDGDIGEIALKKIHELAIRYEMAPKAVSSEFLNALATCSWPGNVRELINVLEYALASAGKDPTLFPKHLPPEYRLSGLEFDAPDLSDAPDTPAGLRLDHDTLPRFSKFRDQLEKAYLKELITRSGRDRKTACRISGISQSRLYSLLKKHHFPGFGSS